jgi:hypothetical protein
MTDYALAFDLVNEQNSDGPRAVPRMPQIRASDVVIPP